MIAAVSQEPTTDQGSAPALRDCAAPPAPTAACVAGRTDAAASVRVEHVRAERLGGFVGVVIRLADGREARVTGHVEAGCDIASALRRCADALEYRAGHTPNAQPVYA